MGTVKVIIVAYNRALPLRILIDSFKVQTDDRWELHVIHDGEVPVTVKRIFDTYATDPKITFYRSDKRLGNYGHPNRRSMLERLPVDEDDFVLITNDDNYYVPEFIRYCQNHMTKTVGMIYFDMLHNYYSYGVLKTKPLINNIDMGAFIVRSSIAKKIGFTSDRYEADGVYCVACANYCRDKNFEIIKIPGILFVHN
jgi:glycosyltransferase involved in cell wall biosynthesis